MTLWLPDSWTNRHSLTRDNFTLDQKPPPEWASSDALGDWSHHHMAGDAAAPKKPTTLLEEVRKAVAQIDLLQTPSTWEDLPFDTAAQDAVPEIINMLAQGIIAAWRNKNTIENNGRKLWASHVLKIMHCALTQCTTSMRTIDKAQSISTKKLYAEWATSLLIAKTQVVAFNSFPFHCEQVTTITHVNGFLDALGIRETEELIGHFTDGEMLKFVERVVKLVLNPA